MRVQNATLSQHRRALSTLAALLLAASLSVAPAAAQDGDTDRIEQSTRDLERVRTRIRALTRQIDADKSRQDDVSQALRATETRIAELVNSLAKLQRDIQDQRRAVEQAEQDRDAALAQAGRQRQALAQQVRAAYQIGRQGRTKLLLNQEDPVAVGRVLTYYDYVAKARSERIKGFRYGKDLVPIAAVDEAAMRLHTERELAVLGFVRRALIKRHYAMGAVEALLAW